jgi:Tol biopolymer transport system component
MGSQPQGVQRPRIDPLLVERILCSQTFVRSQRMCQFLSLLVERANQGNRESLKETEIGVLVFDRKLGYDPKADSIVRTEANRLRRKLSEYFAGDGRESPYLLQLPLGRYELEMHPNLRPVTVESAPAPEPARRTPSRYAIAFAAIALAVVALTAWRLERGAPAALKLTPLTSFAGTESFPSFSPDGKRFAFTWDGEGANSAIYVQALGADAPARLTHSTFKEFRPLWSRDGREIAFLRQVAADRLELRRTSALAQAAGNDETLIGAIAARPEAVPCLSWSPDGAWFVTTEPLGPDGRLRLVVLPAGGGEKRVIRETADRVSFLDAQFSPDGRSLAFVKGFDTAVNELFVAGFPSGPERQLTFDKARIEGIAWGRGGDELVISSGRVDGRNSLWRISIGGKPVRLTEGIQTSVFPAIAPDGFTLAFSRSMDDINIWRRKLGDAERVGASSAWLASSGLDSSPQFSPDGSKVAFRSGRTGPSEIWIAENDGRRVWRLTHFNGPLTGSPRWSPDGKWIAFDSRAGGNANIWIVAATGGEPRRLTPEESNESLPSWSRDGRWVYYNSDQPARYTMWRRPWQGGEPQRLRAHACAGWESPDGKYLYYVHSPAETGLFRAPLTGGPEEPVLPELPAGMWGSWAFGRGGIYFIDRSNAAGTTAWAQFRDDSGAVRRLFPIDNPIGWDGSLAVSPDERWLAWAQRDGSGSDLFVMTNWK